MSRLLLFCGVSTVGMRQHSLFTRHGGRHLPRTSNRADVELRRKLVRLRTDLAVSGKLRSSSPKVGRNSKPGRSWLFV